MKTRVLNTWYWRRWAFTGKTEQHKNTKEEPHSNLTPHTKINSKWIMGLHPKCKTIKVLEKNIGEHLPDVRLDKEFLDLIPKALSVKGKTDKSFLVRTVFCKRPCLKRQATSGRKYLKTTV